MIPGDGFMDKSNVQNHMESYQVLLVSPGCPCDAECGIGAVKLQLRVFPPTSDIASCSAHGYRLQLSTML